MNKLPEIQNNWLRFRKEVTPELTAFRDNKGHIITYSELFEIVSSVSKKLNKKGISKNDKVGIVPQTKVSFPITIFALWQIGAVPVLLNARWTKQEQERTLEISECKLILELEEIEKEGELKKTTGNSDELTFAPNQTAVVIFTSGTTSFPKGVEITFGNLFHNAILFEKFFDARPSEKWLASLPFYHIGGFAMLTRALILGQTVVFADSLKAGDLTKSLLSKKPDYISLVPTQLVQILNNNSNALKGTKNILIGGGPADEELIKKALDLNLPLAKVYGSTETCSFVAGVKGEKLRQNPSAAGKAIPPVKIKITDENGKELPVGETGEIVIYSPTLAKGYLNLPELTNKKFTNNFYRTGDYGFLNKENYLFVLNRREDLIISGGENISPTEVREAILKLEGVKDCFVFPLEDKKWGQVVAAVIVGKIKDKIRLKEMLKGRLASYKIPQRIIFVEKLPVNELGKIDREKVRSLFVTIGKH